MARKKWIVDVGVVVLLIVGYMAASFLVGAPELTSRRWGDQWYSVRGNTLLLLTHSQAIVSECTHEARETGISFPVLKNNAYPILMNHDTIVFPKHLDFQSYSYLAGNSPDYDQLTIESPGPIPMGTYKRGHIDDFCAPM